MRPSLRPTWPGPPAAGVLAVLWTALALGLGAASPAFATDCEATAWPAPAAGVAPIAVRVSGGALEVLRPPGAEPAVPPPEAGAEACLWIEPAAGHTQESGLTPLTGGAAQPPPPRPPQARRFHRVTVATCPGASAFGACLRLENLPELEDTPGRVPALLRLPGRPEPIALVLHRPPQMGFLLLALAAGLAGSFLVTLWGPKLAGLRERRRRLRQLSVRRAHSAEDFMPLLNRVDALLSMCRDRLESGWAPLGVLVFDEGLLDDRLQEAAQLLTLSEEKTRCWQASQSFDLPPSVEAEIADLLRQFDAEVFLLDLPVRGVAAAPATGPQPWFPQPLREAFGRLQSPLRGYHDNLSAAIRQAVRTADDAVTQGPPAAAPAGPGGAGPAARARFLVRALRDEQIAALRPHAADAGSALQSLAPRTVRALDTRLNVWRAAVSWLARLDAGEALVSTPEELLALERGLDDWRRQDLTTGIQGRPDLPALRVLAWNPENRHSLDRLGDVLSGHLAGATPPPEAPVSPPTPGASLSVEGPAEWRVYEPVSLELRLNHKLRHSYLWRQNIKVTWRVVKKSGHLDADILRFAGATAKVDERAPGTLTFECSSARATAFVGKEHLLTRKAVFTVEPLAVAFRDPLTGRFAAPLPLADAVRDAVRVVVRVRGNPDAGLFAGIGTVQGVRLFFSAALTVTLGVVFLDTLHAHAQGWAVYAQAFAWAFGIDVGTVALRSGWKALQDRLTAWRPTSTSPT
jgi:hypothetical protein